MILQLQNHKISRENNIYHKINNKIFSNGVFCIYEIGALLFGPWKWTTGATVSNFLQANWDLLLLLNNWHQRNTGESFTSSFCGWTSHHWTMFLSGSFLLIWRTNVFKCDMSSSGFFIILPSFLNDLNSCITCSWTTAITLSSACGYLPVLKAFECPAFWLLVQRFFLNCTLRVKRLIRQEKEMC